MNDIPHTPRSAPSGYAIQAALSAWQSARMRLLAEDPSLEDDEAALVELLGPEEGAVEDVLARLLRGVLHAEDMCDAAKARAALIKGRADRYQHRAETMRATAFAVMDQIGLMKCELPDLTASVRSGVPKVEVVDEALLPEAFVETRTIRQVDKRTLLAALKSGAKVAGAELSNAAPSLQIKVR